MVNPLTNTDHTNLNEFARKAAARSSGEINIIVVQESDDYREYIFLIGFIGGSILGFLMWGLGLVGDVWSLLIVQLLTIILIDIVPVLRKTGMKLIPRDIRNARAADKATHEYYRLVSSRSPDIPFVLLYVSLAERYVRVVTNPVIHKKISGNWNVVTGHFVSTVKEKNTNAACEEALQRIGEILSTEFPK